MLTQVRQHYLLSLLQNYLITLTNTFDLLGVSWHNNEFGVGFNKFAERFFKEVDVGLASAVLIAMEDTEEIEVERLLEKPLIGLEDEEDEDMEEGEVVKEEDRDEGEKKEKHLGSVPLTKARLNFLLHLLDDIRSFM